MARPIKNELHLEPLPDGRWRLFGYFRGARVRQISRDFTKLERLKLQMERQLETLAESQASQPKLRLTWLTEDQLRDAEAATRQAKGRRLVECVAAADRVLPPVGGKLCTEAKAEWLAVLKMRKRSARTEDKNTRRVDDFLDFTNVKFLEDIRPLMCEQWIYRESTAADYTRITDAQVLRAWLNFCRKRRYLLTSPFELDMKDLSATARTKEPARILTPEQSHAMLAASASLSDGRMLPYTILAIWCFMSPQEIIRTTRKKMKLDASTPVIEVDTVKRRTAKFRSITIPANVLPLLREAVKGWKDDRAVEYSRTVWDRVRERAGLMGRNKARNGRKAHRNSVWQGSICRHTGISMFNQALTARAQRGEFEKESVIAEVCRQAGNTSATAFAHYLTLPGEGDSDRFYAAPTPPMAAAA